MKGLKAWRETHGLTQAELARRVGVHPASVNRWERLDWRPIPLVLKRLLRVIRAVEKQTKAQTPHDARQ